MTEQAKPELNRNTRKTLVGIVTSAKMNKTRRVEVPRLAKHAKYQKYFRRQTVCYVHDEKNESQEGDRVEIAETRPLSKQKRWRLVKIVQKGARFDETVNISATAGEPVSAAEGEPAST